MGLHFDLRFEAHDWQTNRAFTEECLRLYSIFSVQMVQNRSLIGVSSNCKLYVASKRHEYRWSDFAFICFDWPGSVRCTAILVLICT